MKREKVYLFVAAAFFMGLALGVYFGGTFEIVRTDSQDRAGGSSRYFGKDFAREVPRVPGELPDDAIEKYAEFRDAFTIGDRCEFFSERESTEFSWYLREMSMQFGRIDRNWWDRQPDGGYQRYREIKELGCGEDIAQKVNTTHQAMRAFSASFAGVSYEEERDLVPYILEENYDTVMFIQNGNISCEGGEEVDMEQLRRDTAKQRERIKSLILNIASENQIVRFEGGSVRNSVTYGSCDEGLSRIIAGRLSESESSLRRLVAEMGD